MLCFAHQEKKVDLISDTQNLPTSTKMVVQSHLYALVVFGHILTHSPIVIRTDRIPSFDTLFGETFNDLVNILPFLLSVLPITNTE